MGDKTGISWADATWNPVTGCSRISAGCDHCYAERMAHRLQSMGQPLYVDGFKVREHPEMLDRPERWKRPRVIFVCSMGDLFHGDVWDEFILSVYQAMIRAPQHTYVILTKRPNRMVHFMKETFLPWYDGLKIGEIPAIPTIWHGTSIESINQMHRALDLQSLNVGLWRNRLFVSFEPLLDMIEINDVIRDALIGIRQVIIGGESGPQARRMSVMDVASLATVARQAGCDVYMKQLGSVLAKDRGFAGKGGDPAQWPTSFKEMLVCTSAMWMNG